MSTGTPTRERTRREIERQAMRLFAGQGYAATSLQDVATAAGCSKATVLYHFNGKAAMLAAALAPSHAALRELIDRNRALPPDQAQEQAIAGFVELAVARRGVIAVVQEVIPAMDAMPEFTGLVADGLELTRILAGPAAGRPEQDLAKFAIDGLLGQCRHPGGRTDADLRELGHTALHRLLRPGTAPTGHRL